MMSILFILAAGCLATSTAKVMVISYGVCPDVEAPEDFDWQKFQGHWYSYEALDVPYHFLLSCVAMDFTLRDERNINITISGVRKYEMIGLPVWGTQVIIEGEATISNVSRPADLTGFIGQKNHHVHTTRLQIVATDYTSYSLVYACYEPTLFTVRVDAAWILTRERGKKPDNLNSLESRLEKHDINPISFKPTINSDCLTDIN